MKKRSSPKKYSSVLLLWLAITLVWFVYRATTVFPEWFEEIILKPLVFVGPVVFYLQHVKMLRFAALGIRTKPLRPIIIWGVLLGLFLVFEALVVALFKGDSVSISLPFHLLLSNLLISLATAFSEEILYRGFIMEQFWQKMKNPWTANGASAILFMLAHIGQGVFVLHYSSAELAKYLGSMVLLGITNGFIYYKTRSVMASSFFHTLWNFTIPFIG